MEDRRKVLFTNGMSNDFMLIITDAPQKAIESYCYRVNKVMEDGEHIEPFDTLKAKYYVKELLDSEKVENVTIRLQGKIVYFTIDYKEDVSIDQAKEIATKTLTEFTEEQKKFYDFSYFLTQSKVKDSDSYPTMGNKHPKNATIAWLKNR